jgi:exopolysaccharide production protein ExoQ
MASLALLLCTAFVLFLLWLERRPSRGVSPALWIPTLWMLIVASRPLATWFFVAGSFNRGNESGSELDRWVLTALTIAAIIVLVHRRIDWWGSLRTHKWLLLLLAYMFVSTFWSEITLIALKRWIRELIVLVMALVIMSEVNSRQALESILRRTAYILVPFSVVLIRYYPLLGRRYGKFSGIEMWTGVTGQKNHLGRLCMISAFFLLWALYERWRERPRTGGGRFLAWADVSVIVIAMYLLVGSNSSTSLATLGLGAAIFLGLRLFHRLKFSVPQVGLLALMIFLMVFGVSTPFLGGASVAGYADLLGRDTTLTGRTEVWADVLPAWELHPLLGYGFGSFWTDARRQLYDIPTAHNGYLDILLELGEVGLGFYVVWLLSCARQLHRTLAQDYDWASFGICLLLMALVYNITESALNTFTEHMTVVPALVTLVLSCRIKPCTTSAHNAANRFETAAWTSDRLPGLTRNNTRS